MGLLSSSSRSTSNQYTDSANADLKTTLTDSALNQGVALYGNGNSTVAAGGAGTFITASKGASVTATDLGAVSRSMDAITRGMELNTGLAEQTVQASTGLLSGAFSTQAESMKQLTAAVQEVKSADVRTMGIAALALVAGVFAFAFAKARKA